MSAIDAYLRSLVYSYTVGHAVESARTALYYQNDVALWRRHGRPWYVGEHITVGVLLDRSVAFWNSAVAGGIVVE